jgi:hypothetical protein
LFNRNKNSFLKSGNKNQNWANPICSIDSETSNHRGEFR